jgi:hypothetical protein
VGADKAGVIGGRRTKSNGMGGVVVVLECGFGRTWSGMDQQEGEECVNHAGSPSVCMPVTDSLKL